MYLSLINILTGITFTGYILSIFATVWVSINCTVNSVIYGIFNKKYRDAFLRYFGPKMSKKNKYDNDSSVSTAITNVRYRV